MKTNKFLNIRKSDFRILGALFLSLLFMGAGCEKDPPASPPPELETNMSYTLATGTVTVSWETKYADICLCNNIPVALSGNMTFPNCDSTLIFTAKGVGKSVIKEVRVLKVPDPQIITSHSLSLGIVTLDWSTKYADICLLNGVLVTLSGSITFPNCDSTLVFTAKGSGKSVTKEVKINKFPLPEIVFTSIPTLPYGGGIATVNYTTTNTIWVQVNIGGVVANYPPNGSLKLPSVTITTTFVFTLVGHGGQKEVSVVVLVYVPTANELLLCLAPWNMIKLEFSTPPGSPWVEFEIWECSRDDLYFFVLSPTQIMWEDNGEIRCSPNEPRTYPPGPWSLTGNILNLGMNCRVTTLNQDTLVWIYDWDNSARETFVHP